MKEFFEKIKGFIPENLAQANTAYMLEYFNTYKKFFISRFNYRDTAQNNIIHLLIKYVSSNKLTEYEKKNLCNYFTILLNIKPALAVQQNQELLTPLHTIILCDMENKFEVFATILEYSIPLNLADLLQNERVKTELVKMLRPFHQLNNDAFRTLFLALHNSIYSNNLLTEEEREERLQREFRVLCEAIYPDKDLFIDVKVKNCLKKYTSQLEVQCSLARMYGKEKAKEFNEIPDHVINYLEHEGAFSQPKGNIEALEEIKKLVQTTPNTTESLVFKRVQTQGGQLETNATNRYNSSRLINTETVERKIKVTILTKQEIASALSVKGKENSEIALEYKQSEKVTTNLSPAEEHIERYKC